MLKHILKHIIEWLEDIIWRIKVWRALRRFYKFLEIAGYPDEE